MESLTRRAPPRKEDARAAICVMASSLATLASRLGPIPIPEDCASNLDVRVAQLESAGGSEGMAKLAQYSHTPASRSDWGRLKAD